MDIFAQKSYICTNTLPQMKSLHFISVFFALLAICSCTRTGYHVFSGYAQGGEYRITANLNGCTVRPRDIDKHIGDILTSIDTTFSGYNRNSVLSRLNDGQAVTPNEMFLKLLRISEDYTELTEGAFDVWAGPLFDIWGFGFTRDSLPSPERVVQALEQCRRKRILNFNAIAQGYTCDTIAAYLNSIGVKDMLVDVGEIYCQGRNPSGRNWKIGIDTPADGNNSPGAELSGTWESDGGCHGIVTSGNYRKFYVSNGRKYAHTIDPRSGYPVDHNLLSATVIAPTATDADALATYYMVIGFDKAREHILSRTDLEACLISSDSTWFSPGFRGQP